MNAPTAPAFETQETITEWADTTFGVKHPAEVAARMNVEAAELIAGLATVATRPVSEFDPETLAALREECADVAVMLAQVAEKLGVDLAAAVDAKMAKNRARVWARSPSGKMQHVDTFLEPGSGLTMELDKFYLLSDSGSAYSDQGYSSPEEAADSEAVRKAGFSGVVVPTFKGPEEGWTEMGVINAISARDLRDWWAANPLSAGEPA